MVENLRGAVLWWDFIDLSWFFPLSVANFEWYFFSLHPSGWQKTSSIKNRAKMVEKGGGAVFWSIVWAFCFILILSSLCFEFCMILLPYVYLIVFVLYASALLAFYELTCLKLIKHFDVKHNICAFMYRFVLEAIRLSIRHWCMRNHIRFTNILCIYELYLSIHYTWILMSTCV